MKAVKTMMRVMHVDNAAGECSCDQHQPAAGNPGPAERQRSHPCPQEGHQQKGKKSGVEIPDCRDKKLKEDKSTQVGIAGQVTRPEKAGSSRK